MTTVDNAMRVLITGAGGQLGSELVRRAAGRALEPIPVTHAEMDITVSDSVLRVFEEHTPALVINAAAYTAVDRAEEDPQHAFAVNRDGARNLAEACREVGIPLFHISTDYVFDGEKSTPYTESDSPNPRGVYARSKLEGEQEVAQVLERHLTLRVGWLFGAAGRNFVRTMLRRAGECDNLRVVCDQRGTPTWTGDFADCLLTLAERQARGESPAWGLYHYSGGPATTWFEFAGEILELARELGMIKTLPQLTPISSGEFPGSAPRPANSVLDAGRLERVFGIAPGDWRNGLRQVLQERRGQPGESTRNGPPLPA